MNSLGWGHDLIGLHPYKKRKRRDPWVPVPPPFRYLSELSGHSQEVASANQEASSPQEAKELASWSWNHQPPELWKNKIMLFM